MEKLEANINVFESIKHIDKNECEFWYARELQKALGYKEWRKFEGVIVKAKESCNNSNVNVYDHFVGIDKMIDIAKGGKRKVIDYIAGMTDRYAVEQYQKLFDPQILP